MARARNIKPAFFTNEQVSENCPLGRLLFIGLWTMADYKGDIEWKEKTLKIQILPWDDCSLKQLAINLDKSRLVPESSHSDRADSPILIPDSVNLKPESRNLKPETIKPPTANAAVEVFAHWQTRMNHPGAKLDAKRSKQITAALKLGYTVEHLKAAIDGCAKSPFHMGNNDRHTVFDSIELIFRSADKIDTFIKLNNTEIKPGAGYEQPKSNLDKLIQQYGQQQPEPPPADYIDGEFLDSDGGDLWPTLGPVIRADS